MRYYTGKELAALVAITEAARNWDASTDEASLASEEAMDEAVRNADGLGLSEATIMIARLKGEPEEAREEIFFNDLDGGASWGLGIKGLKQVVEWLNLEY